MKKKTVESELTLDIKSIPVSELKKIWGTKKLEDGTLMITSYKGEETNIVIPSLIGKVAVTAIDKDTFSTNAPRINEVQKKNRINIISVEFPGSIKTIPQHMFYDGYSARTHSDLKRIILNEGIEKISEKAFEDCDGITEISIPNSVKEIGRYAFIGCRELKKVHLPENIDSLTSGVFSKTGLETFTVPDSVVNFESCIFSDCIELCTVSLPETMKEIPDGMFRGCAALSKISLPQNTAAIGDSAFARCGFEEFTVPENVVTIENEAFRGCEKLKRIILPKKVNLGREVFTKCNGLANEQGQIVINRTLFGINDTNEGWGLSVEKAIKPLILGDNIDNIAVSRDLLPEIVCREFSDIGEVTIDVSTLSVGDEINFGRFPDCEDYIMRPLKWRVLGIKDGKALVITVQEILGQSNELAQKSTWAECPARKLLNDGFYKSAFTGSEREQIVLSVVSTQENREQGVEGGPDTEDCIFLLSMDEVEQYMPTEDSRKSVATEYARRQYPARRDVGFWQLRTPGNGWGSVAVSDGFGDYCASTGNHVGHSYWRPAMWIK